jgi:hypothetical protein
MVAMRGLSSFVQNLQTSPRCSDIISDHIFTVVTLKTDYKHLLKSKFNLEFAPI